MKSVLSVKMCRAAAVMLCGAGLVVSAAVAQQDAPPPPPTDSQQQGPPMGMGGPGRMDPAQHMAMMQKRLGLSDDQMSQVKAIFEDGKTKMDALRANTSLAPADRRAQAMAMRQEQMTKVRAVLTPEQQTKFDAMQARMQERRGQGMMGGPGGPPPPPPATPPAGSPQM